MTKAFAFCSLFFLPLPPANHTYRPFKHPIDRHKKSSWSECLMRRHWSITTTYRGRGRRRRSHWPWRRRRSPTTGAPSTPGSCPARRRGSWSRRAGVGRCRRHTPRWCPCSEHQPYPSPSPFLTQLKALAGRQQVAHRHCSCGGEGDGGDGDGRGQWQGFVGAGTGSSTRACMAIGMAVASGAQWKGG